MSRKQGGLCGMEPYAPYGHHGRPVDMSNPHIRTEQVQLETTYYLLLQVTLIEGKSVHECTVMARHICFLFLLIS